MNPTDGLNEVQRKTLANIAEAFASALRAAPSPPDRVFIFLVESQEVAYRDRKEMHADLLKCTKDGCHCGRIAPLLEKPAGEGWHYVVVSWHVGHHQVLLFGDPRVVGTAHAPWRRTETKQAGAN